MRGSLGALGLVFIASASGAAAPPVSDEVVVSRIFELNKSALRKIEERKFDKARGLLLDAEGMGKARGGVVAGAVLASTYLQLGAVEAMTGGDAERARRYFRRALCRRPRIRPSGPILDPEVDRLFVAAKAEVNGPPRECQSLWEVEQRNRPSLEPYPPARAQALDCFAPDAALAGTDFIIRCAVAEKLPVVKLTMRYRQPRSDDYAAVEMTRNARGWWTAAIPGKNLDGLSLQYFVEGKNEVGKTIVSNGEANSPNVALVFHRDYCFCD